MTLLLVTLLLKSLLVFAAAGLLLLILRRSSAAARHLVCLLTLGAVLALPLCSLSLPGWHLSVLATRQEAEPTLVRQEPTPPRSSATLPKREGAEFQTIPPPTASESLRPPVAGGPLWSEERTKQGGGFLTQGGGFLLYLLGLLLASARPLLGLWGIRRLSRACIAVDDAPTLAVAADCARLLALPTPRLCRAGVPVPMTWGWRRPVLVLPLASADWPEDRLRSVLLHEMAHVRRRDWPGHRLADFACALLWFHPLVWLTARRLRAESELACDDLVLASGIPAPDYARHLLEIASALPHVPNRSHTAIAMAQTSQIESRLHMILDKTRTRRAVARRALMLALIPGTAALVTLAVLRPDAKAQTAPTHPASSPATAPFSGTLLSVGDLKLNGKSLLAGVTDANKPGSLWWSASGKVLPTPVYDTNTYRGENHASPDKHTVSLAFRLSADAVGTTVRYELPQSTQSSSDGFWPTKIAENANRTEAQIFAQTHGTRVVTATFPPSLAKTSLRVGIASGSWTDSVHYLPPNRYNGSITETDGGTVVFYPVATSGFNLTFIPNKISGYAQKQDLRIVAIDARDHKILPTLIGDKGNGTTVQINAQFDVPIGQVKDIRIQTRPFQWVEYKDVALKPVQ